MCFKDFGLRDQNIIMSMLFACLVCWHNSSHLYLENRKKLRHDLLNPAWAGLNSGITLVSTRAIAIADACALKGPQSLAHCV